MDAEVAVIGTGTMGSMTLWQLAERGVDAIGFEQFGIGHDRSAAGGETRIFRTSYLEGAEYVPLLQAAKREWRHLEEQTGRNLLNLNGGLMIGDPDAPHMENVLRSIEWFRLEHEVLSHEQAQVRYPQHRLLPNEIMILDKQAGFIRPEYSVVTAAQRAVELGARVYRNTRVTAIEDTGSGVRIHTSNGSYLVEQVIVTAGPWVTWLVPETLQHITVERLITTWFPAKTPGLFSPERFPIFIRVTNGYDFSGMPSMDSCMVKIAINTGYDKVADPDNLSCTVAPAQLVPIQEAVSQFLPDVYSEPVRVSNHMDAYTTDHHAIVGRLAQMKNVIVLAGFSGHGFKLSPLFGKIAAEIAIDGKTNHPITHLSPNRFLL
ncbi:N-methyl-L-tryptophan oxidase [Alicyclobacillus ferrooxydans]|uniref:Sarcosine oxidase n=1 Tax=Alicyclobacillus ferrooxydans TaxID=471514 RepID=A0A0P9CCB1_9BACL|nr:N-methyl-L-tryptophan oxidase [Alicyclobacillus ferrooxydans]KPV43115.1 sarcosine oxidase [Alicyclobacillus ferrooxydans]